MRRSAPALSFLLALALPPAAVAQEAPATPAADDGRWESLGSAVVAPSGDVVAYRVTRNDESAELRLAFLDGDSTRVVPWGDDPVFSADGRWIAYVLEPSTEERERLEEDDEPVRLRAGLVDLRTGDERTFEAVRAFSFDAEAGHLALHGYPPEEPEGKGADLRVLDLSDGTSMAFGNVGELVWSHAGSALAMTVATGEDGFDGVQVWDAGTGRLRALDSSGSAYSGLAWREDAPDLAALRSVEPASEDGSAHEVLAWRGVLDGPPTPRVLAAGVPGMADTLEVVAARTPAWSDDGTMISFGLRPVEPGEEDGPEDAGEGDGEEGEGDAAEGDREGEEGDEDAEDEPELPGVQIWHTSDVRIFPQQQAMRPFAERRSLLAVWHLDEGRVVRVGSDLLAGARLLEGWAHALEDDDAPYPWGAMFGRPYHDVWLVDVATGERELLLERVRSEWASPAGGHVVSWDGSDYHVHDLRTGGSRNLTANLDAVFADTAYDTPTDLPPPWDFGPDGWLEGDAAVLLPDRYDLWRVALDGSGATRLTDGRAERLVHRVARLADDDEPGLDPAGPLYLTLHGEVSEKRGYARWTPGGGVERLLLDDAWVGGLTKADSAGVYVHRRMAFDDPPDLFAGGPGLDGAARITDINPFFDEVAWGTSRLVDFTSEAGEPLQAVLYLPPGYTEGSPVPTIVYTYEIRSPTIHRFNNPDERSYYNFTDWTRAGYAVLQPDIVYRARDPGVSALEAVRAAVARVVEMGVADPDAVGLVGHSWGGYQATYLPTRTDIFAASVAGAPLTDFLSMMGTIHWNPGVPEVDHWETGQARMEVPYWDDPEAHRRNSPVEKVHELETPLLMAFGDDDGVVDWDQGTEFYNLARRAGKQMVLLVYEGEDHGFRQEANQRDYHRRILEWFGHYLKGEPAPAWITEGVRLEDLEAEKKRLAG